MRRKKESVG